MSRSEPCYDCEDDEPRFQHGHWLRFYTAEALLDHLITHTPTGVDINSVLAWWRTEFKRRTQALHSGEKNANR